MEHTRVILGGTLVGEALSLQVMATNPNAPELVFAAVDRYENGWSSPFRTWRNGGYGWVDGAYGRIDAIWPLADVDPLSLLRCRIEGALAISSGDAPRFCGECGAARIPEARFCGGCGKALSPSMSGASSLDVVRDMLRAPAGAGTRFVGLLEACGALGAVPPEARGILCEYLANDFAEPAANFVDEDEPSPARLTLRSAQDIHEALSRKLPLPAVLTEPARLLLTRAPVTFGYWGPLKALLKAGPLPGLEDEHGAALGRLSRREALQGRSTPPDVQDVSPLAAVVRVPDVPTLNYMRRRGRRDLATLGEHDEDRYARVAEAVLRAWNQSLHPTSFAPAYILRGHRGLRHGGRLVNLGEWWTTRSDPYPSIWNARLGRVEALLNDVKNSPDVFAWAFQVLEDCGRAPRLTPKFLGLALKCRNEPLFFSACELAIDTPEHLATIEAAGWSHLILTADLGLATRVAASHINNLERRYGTPPAVDAARGVLKDRGRQVAEDRLVLAAHLYLRCPHFTFERDAETDRIAARVLLRTGRLLVDDEGASILRLFDVAVLLDILRDLPDLDATVRSLLLDLVQEKSYSVNITALVTEAVSADHPWELDLLWRLIDSRGGFDRFSWQIRQGLAASAPTPDTLGRFVAMLLQRIGVERLSEAMLLLEECGIEMDPDRLTRSLTANSLGLSALWTYLRRESSEAMGRVLLGDESLLMALGAHLSAADVQRAVSNQLPIATAYLESSSPRLRDDLEFSLAAAKNPDVALQCAAIRALQRYGLMDRAWLVLAEVALPSGLEAARAYLDGVPPSAMKDKVLACLDSQVLEVRELGLQLLQQHQPVLEDGDLWQALAESDELAIQRLVAEEALVREIVSPNGAFDRRVLTARRRNRIGKTAVQRRLGEAAPDALIDSDRMAALLSLARSATRRDREWALTRLAVLNEAGIALEGVSFSAVSGDVS
jgi:hypothetical protein